jgi:30S ribosomal protein S31
MGKGDKKSRRGKIIIGSYGVRRRKASKGKEIVKVEVVAVETVEKVKKVTEKVKAEPKPKTKAADPVAVVGTEIADNSPKVIKKAVKKAKVEDVLEA